MALIGWLRDAGDLRVPHFFATHAMHALPLGALAVSVWRREDRGFGWVCAAVYGAFVAGTFAQALAGLPFLPLG